MFNASINASIGFNQVSDKMKEAYRNPLQQDVVSVSVSIPLVDWGVRKGKHNIAKNNLNVTQISARQEELTVEEDVIMTVGDFNIQQNLIPSAEEALDLAVMAYSETKQRFSALQNYWLSYFKIRKLTLHDFETGISLAREFDFTHGL